MPRDEHLTRVELINPALHERGWTEALIKEERTPGGVDIVAGKPVKRKGRTDYLLCLPLAEDQPPLPVALVEAKAEDKLPSLGIQQAKDYMRKFNVPFVFSSNGNLYAEFAEDTGKIKDALHFTNFPTPDELRKRYEKVHGFLLESDAASPLLFPYKGGDNARWYFQDAAVRAVLEKIARGGKRALLSLATGTGKTIIAAQLLFKIAQAGKLKRALFVCDRDELRTQGYQKLHNIFGDNVQMVSTDNPQKNAKILVATYQALNVTAEDDEPRFWRENYPKNYFSHIIIDECHRSAWGKWSILLTDNPDAVHVGLTATPRKVVGGKKIERAPDEEITAHNVDYFGEPVYEYTMGDAQDDGYIAACEVVRRDVDLDKKVITREDIEKKSAFDPYTGRLVKPEEIKEKYTSHDYDDVLMLDDRVVAMCEDLFNNLLATGGPHQKTIIFCTRDNHANQVMIALNNIYNEWCRANKEKVREMYAFQCTGNPDLRPSADKLIPDFRGSKKSHYIATTVDLLTTGVDIPNLDNVVFFRYLESPIMFYQMVGRGTRTGEPRGSKQIYRIYDYTNATRLFGEPFISKERPSAIDIEGESPVVTSGEPRPKRSIVRVGKDSFTVEVEGQGCSVLCQEGGRDILVPLEEYEQKLAASLVEKAPTLDDLRRIWVTQPARNTLLKTLFGGEGAIRLIRKLEDEEDCDLYDVLAGLGYGLSPKSRKERAAAFTYKNRKWLREMPEKAVKVIESIASQFSKGGIEELETTKLFDERDIVRLGGFEAIKGLKKTPDKIIQEVKVRLLT